MPHVCRRSSSREATFSFEFRTEKHDRDLITICMDGALHASASAATSELNLLTHPAFRALTARGPIVRS